MTKSYLLALALLWEEPDQAIRDCQFESSRVPHKFDEIGANKVLCDVLAGRTITASCRRHKVRMRDFEFVLQNFLKNLHNSKFLDPEIKVIEDVSAGTSSNSIGASN